MAAPASPAHGAPGADYLYVAGSASDRLLGYRVGPEALPRLVADVATGFGNLSVKESADHRFLYVLTIAPTRRGAAVAIGPVGSPAGGPVPMPVVSPDSLNVYVSNYAAGSVTRFELRADSTVSPARETMRTGGGPVSPSFSPDGQYLYTANEHTSSVSVFRQQPSTGALVEVAGSPFPATGLTPHGIGLSPDGRFLYTPNALTNDISGFAVEPDGALRPLPGSPFPGGPVGTLPGQVFVSSDGQRLYAVDLAGTSPAPAAALRSYRIAPDGTLTPDPAPAVGTGLLFSAASMLVAGR